VSRGEFQLRIGLTPPQTYLFQYFA
jgi:hypothetical protein